MNFRAILNFILSYFRLFRFAFLAGFDFLIVFLSAVCAIFLYTRVVYLPITWPVIFSIIFILFAIRFAFFSIFRVYDVSFQYANLLLTVKIASILVGSSVLAFFVLRPVFPGLWPPLVAVVEMMFCIVGAIFFRLSSLLYWELSNLKIRSGQMTAVVYGAGHTGRGIAQELRQGGSNTKILGFIDDDPNLKNRIIFGHRVLGNIDQLELILTKMPVDQLIVAIPSLPGERLKTLRRECLGLNIAVKVIPSVYEVYNKPPEQIVTGLRDLDLEDLLRRSARKVPFDQFKAYFEGKTLMVTGGGGSIGLELVSQLIRLNPAKVVVADMSEFNLYEVENRFPEAKEIIDSRLIDLKDFQKLEALFQETHPQVIFHAAAYKHVHFVERNPLMGVVNNVVTLRNTLLLADQFGVDRFVFISSDKAVLPSNVMGATKRIGELYVQALNTQGHTRCCCVRFGNVVGSSGSLIPNVLKRIREGRPIEVTDPDMTRYFMSLPEAVSLVLQACILSKGGEIFVLDMGEPVKVVDLIREICLLNGKQLGKDLPLEIVGIRPGEKLHEELVYPEENTHEVADGIFMASSDPMNFDEVELAVGRILNFATSNDLKRTTQEISALVTPGPKKDAVHGA